MSLWGYPICPKVSGIRLQGTTSILGIRRLVGSVYGGRMPFVEARELLEHKHPQFRGDPDQVGKGTRTARKGGS